MSVARPSVSADSRQARASRAFQAASALVAGILGWGFIQTQHPVFSVAEEYHITELPDIGSGNANSTAPVDARRLGQKFADLLAQRRRVDLLNAALNFGVLGGALAAALAMAAVSDVSMRWRVILAIPMGAAAGSIAGLVGCLAHLAVVPYTADMGQPSVFQSIKINFALFGALGLGVGAVTGALTRSMRNVGGGAAAGLMAGALTSLTFPIVCALLMPVANLQYLIPTEIPSRLLWIGMGTALLGLIVPLGLTSRLDQRASPTG